MPPILTLKPKWWAGGLCSLLFIFTGLPLLHYPGLQNDELLFAAPLYVPESAVFHARVSHHNIPVMVMSYIGALKSWLYAPIMAAAGVSYLSIRLPVLIIGSLTIWIVFIWLEKIHSRRAAWTGALLLATDTTFLLTTCFDWGPVALQHGLIALGAMLVVHFHHKRTVAALAGGFLCFGLAAWDKALSAWVLGGLAVAVVAILPRELLRNLTWKNSIVAAFSFLMGASPLIVYNVREHYPTFHATSGFTTKDLYPKSFVARACWEGVALFGYLSNPDSAPNPHGPRNALEQCSFWLRARVGEHTRNSLNWAAFAGFGLLLPALWWPASRRTVLVCLIVIGVAWLQMACTQGAGGAAHHVVLLWPFPHIALAVIFAETSRHLGGVGRWLLGAAIAFLIGSNLLVTNQYLYQFARNGAAGSWTDAMYAAAYDLGKSPPDRIMIYDWGLINPLQVLDGGRLQLDWSWDTFENSTASMPPDLAKITGPGNLWLGHRNGYEQFPGINGRVEAFLQRNGLEKEPVKTYRDSNARPILESFRLRRR